MSAKPLILDSATRARLRLIYPDIARRWKLVAERMWAEHGLILKVSDGIRTVAYQQSLYAQGRTKPGKIVTYSKPGDTLHHYGVAVDSCFSGPDPYLEKQGGNGHYCWKEFGRIAEEEGFTWGGAWSKFIDRPHLQLTYGMHLEELKMLYQVKGLWSVYSRLDHVLNLPIGGEWYGPQASAKLIRVGQIKDAPLELTALA